ncbi:hypothetical protein R69927_07643 [Paraburkholderia domus]|nr:hypothetical protein R69749_02103 [Paraburkholderia domus]CAE6839881.1 hypothetical protein R75483_07097 [Paraburkholderia domus]CAE6849259.1 hypothetical protein R70006_07479 [Paraburkholderia domus]CAE6940080.1 hypothetical protein R69927_07643 [Paraburkholderia domus]CAE6964034.1 hypothetical protein R70199_07551 [Paraburkholderia domus]
MPDAVGYRRGEVTIRSSAMWGDAPGYSWRCLSSRIRRYPTWVRRFSRAPADDDKKHMPLMSVTASHFESVALCA